MFCYLFIFDRSELLYDLRKFKWENFMQPNYPHSFIRKMFPSAEITAITFSLFGASPNASRRTDGRVSVAQGRVHCTSCDQKRSFSAPAPHRPAVSPARLDRRRAVYLPARRFRLRRAVSATVSADWVVADGGRRAGYDGRHARQYRRRDSV